MPWSKESSCITKNSDWLHEMGDIYLDARRTATARGRKLNFRSVHVSTKNEVDTIFSTTVGDLKMTCADAY